MGIRIIIDFTIITNIRKNSCHFDFFSGKRQIVTLLVSVANGDGSSSPDGAHMEGGTGF